LVCLSCIHSWQQDCCRCQRLPANCPISAFHAIFHVGLETAFFSEVRKIPQFRLFSYVPNLNFANFPYSLHHTFLLLLMKSTTSLRKKWKKNFSFITHYQYIIIKH
jgi:hypothetical protein